MPALEWAQTARADLLAIIDYISNDNPDAAQRLRDDIETKTSKLPEHPRLYRRGRIEGTREMVVWSNFILIYQEDAFAVRILRVLHAAQQWPPAFREPPPDFRRPRQRSAHPPCSRYSKPVGATDIPASSAIKLWTAASASA